MVNTFVRFGKQPASPAPNKKRFAASDQKLEASPVAAVNADHHNTIRVSTRRGPIQSPIQPPGISNSEYASVNAPKITPIRDFEKPKSADMTGAACEMHTRSM